MLRSTRVALGAAGILAVVCAAVGFNLSGVLSHGRTTLRTEIKAPSGGRMASFFEALPKNPDYALQRILAAEEKRRSVASCGTSGADSAWQGLLGLFLPAAVHAQQGCQPQACGGQYWVPATGQCGGTGCPSGATYPTTTNDYDPQWQTYGFQLTGGASCAKYSLCTAGSCDNNQCQVTAPACTPTSCPLSSPVCQADGTCGPCYDDSPCEWASAAAVGAW